jgi:hypothetical protein
MLCSLLRVEHCFSLFFSIELYRRYIPEDSILHNHRSEEFKSYEFPSVLSLESVQFSKCIFSLREFCISIHSGQVYLYREMVNIQGHGTSIYTDTIRKEFILFDTT